MHKVFPSFIVTIVMGLTLQRPINLEKNELINTTKYIAVALKTRGQWHKNSILLSHNCQWAPTFSRTIWKNQYYGNLILQGFQYGFGDILEEIVL